jgi:protein associated with RNAse G/E
MTSAVTAWLVDDRSDLLCWFVSSGTGGRPHRGRSPSAHDQIWVTARGKWWVLCGESGEDGALASVELHAACPAERPSETLITWIDLDLDFVVRGERAELVDIDPFHARARALGYPTHVVHGAWAGIAELAPCFTTRAWPFDGTLEDWLIAARAQVVETTR